VLSKLDRRFATASDGKMQAKALSIDAAEDILVCVDSNDNVLGFKGKYECHTGEGILHRAFSVFLFNARSEVLLQLRAPGKRLWPNYWSNSCCSHPRQGEQMEDAIQRRLVEELGVRTSVRHLYNFEYRARYLDEGTEHELCSVAVGRVDGSPSANEHEVAKWRFVDPEELDADIAANPDLYTPWMKMEWARIRSDYRGTIAAL